MIIIHFGFNSFFEIESRIMFLPVCQNHICISNRVMSWQISRRLTWLNLVVPCTCAEKLKWLKEMREYEDRIVRLIVCETLLALEYTNHPTGTSIDLTWLYPSANKPASWDLRPSIASVGSSWKENFSKL